MHLKSLRLSPKPTWSKSEVSHKTVCYFCQVNQDRNGASCVVVWSGRIFPSLAVIWERPVSLSPHWYSFSLACCPSPGWTTESLQKAFPKTSVLRGDKGNQCVDLLGYVKRYGFSLCWHYYVSTVDSHDKLKIPQTPSDSASANQIIYSKLPPFHLGCKYSLCRRASLEPLEEYFTVLWASLLALLSCTPFLFA